MVSRPESGRKVTAEQSGVCGSTISSMEMVAVEQGGAYGSTISMYGSTISSMGDKDHCREGWDLWVHNLKYGMQVTAALKWLAGTGITRAIMVTGYLLRWGTHFWVPQIFNWSWVFWGI